MKYIFLIFACFSSLTMAASAATPELNVYLRAGTGTNGRGGGKECINNAGSGGNEFRLGNECGVYGEFSLGALILKAETETAPFWRFHTNFAVVYNAHQDFEASTNNWVLREVYTEGGRFEGMNLSLWAGKRFLRWGDVHMDDFFPIDMSGPGAGIGDIKFGSGILSAAFIQVVPSLEKNTAIPTAPVTTAPPTEIPTELKNAAKSSLHLKWDQVESDFGAWSFWLAGATTAGTRQITTSIPAPTPTAKEYVSTGGSLFGVKNNSKFGKISNEIGFAMGQGSLASFSAGGLVQDCANAASPDCQVASSVRARAWNNLFYEGDRWSTQMALIYDQFDNGTESNQWARWTSVGIRPIYWFSDHVSLAFEAGISSVDNEADGQGLRTLTRTTVAPQLSLGKGYYSRPVIRAYYTRSQWNEANKISVANTSFANDTAMDSIGFQTEIWF